jgi:hypothetical protein
MATTENWNLQYPLANDPVNVHGDFKDLATSVQIALNGIDTSIIQVSVINNSGQILSAGTPVYATGYSTATTISKALPTTTSPILGLLKTQLTNGQSGVCVVAGVLQNINTSSFDNGDTLYVGETGGLVGPEVDGSKPVTAGGAVGVVAHSNATGIIIVEAKGNGTWGALKNGLA